MKPINVEKRLPKEGQYVLAHLTLTNWHDKDDPGGNRYWVVVKFQKCDTGFNNLKPFEWSAFGPSTYFGQDVDYWCELPNFEVK